MTPQDDKEVLRARDFWTALVLLLVSAFFVWKTTAIPMFGENRAGVGGVDWYNSAAIVPMGIFLSLFVLSCALLITSIQAGAAARAMTSSGLGWINSEVSRVGTISIVLLAYIGGLVPRVDFFLSSGLLITALIFGYHGGHRARAFLSAGFVGAAGLYAILANKPQAEWKALDDDWVTLIAWLSLTGIVIVKSKHKPGLRIVPVIAVCAPLVLVCAMAFGFRQNVPARSGLVFQHIEYHYYVTLRPLWRN